MMLRVAVLPVFGRAGKLLEISGGDKRNLEKFSKNVGGGFSPGGGKKKNPAGNTHRVLSKGFALLGQYF
jgi:hypothetical protein